MTDYKLLSQQKTELLEAWNFLELAHEFPSKQIPLWLLDYGKDAIVSAFRVLKAKEEKIADPTAYLATMLRNAKKQNMTAEERTQQISQMRSAVGKLGAARAHEKQLDQIKAEFVEVCND
jgi:hypothetical protein